MEISITDVILSKEITWNEIKDRNSLFAAMMRNRVTIKGTTKFSATMKSDHYKDMWIDFAKDVRRFCDTKNVGLYCLRATSEPTCDGHRAEMWSTGSFKEHPNGARGEFMIYFEDSGDYARFLKEKAVMFKLGINTQ